MNEELKGRLHAGRSRWPARVLPKPRRPSHDQQDADGHAKVDGRRATAHGAVDAEDGGRDEAVDGRGGHLRQRQLMQGRFKQRPHFD